MNDHQRYEPSNLTLHDLQKCQDALSRAHTCIEVATAGPITREVAMDGFQDYFRRYGRGDEHERARQKDDRTINTSCATRHDRHKSHAHLHDPAHERREQEHTIALQKGPHGREQELTGLVDEAQEPELCANAGWG